MKDKDARQKGGREKWKNKECRKKMMNGRKDKFSR
jgi:hypothetical protein